MSDTEAHHDDTIGQDRMAFLASATGIDSPPEQDFGSLPRGWRQYEHPNGDIYFYHQGNHLITPDDIRDPDILEYVLDAREEQLQALEEDENAPDLPGDIEMIVMEATEDTAMVQMFSRAHKIVFVWAEDTGVTYYQSSLSYWSLIAEYPSHFANLPRHIEEEFLEALHAARQSTATGTAFVYTEQELDRIYARYQELSNLRAQGRTSSPSLAWLIGSVMPLDEVGRRIGDEQMAALINGVHS